MPKKSRKSDKGKKDKKKRGISNELICIETAIDRKCNVLMGAVCKGRITRNEVVNFFNGKLGEDVIFCTDSHKSYYQIENELHVDLKLGPRGKLYHPQYVNALHSAF